MKEEDWKPPKRLSIEKIRKLNKKELDAYFDSWRRPVKPSKPRPKPNYKEMSYEEALEGSYWSAYHAVNNGISGYKQSLRIALKKRPQKEEFHFFWSNDSPFSQWYKTDFMAPIYFSGDMLWMRQRAIHGNVLVSFSSGEQMMMFYKAALFGDVEISKKILEIRNVRKIKELGRQVKRFDQQIWDCYKYDIVRYVTHCKFRNNKELWKTLLATYPKTLVEASPYDKVWGIGLSEDDERAKDRSTWQGENLLGEILTSFRDKFHENNGDVREYP